MSVETDNPGKLAFFSRCIPGSVAEQKERERLVEFHRVKALRKAEEESNRSEMEAQRHQEYLTACEANRERRQRERAAYAPHGGFLRP
jgi:hypothetical protein